MVVKNGTIDITDVTASGDCIMGIGDRNADATLTLEDVNLTGSGYSSAFAVLMVYGDGTLNVKGGEWNLSDDQSTAGGVIKNESGAGDSGNVNITGTTMQFADVERGIAGATVVLDDVDLTITGGDNGINGSKLTVKDSDITITGGAGRALTVTDYDVSVESSTLNLSGNGEADIRFKSSNTLTVDFKVALQQGEFFLISSQINRRHNVAGISLKHPDNLSGLSFIHSLELSKITDVLLALSVKGSRNIRLEVCRELLLAVRAFSTRCTGIMGMTITDPIGCCITESLHEFCERRIAAADNHSIEQVLSGKTAVGGSSGFFELRIRSG